MACFWEVRVVVRGFWVFLYGGGACFFSIYVFRVWWCVGIPISTVVGVGA